MRDITVVGGVTQDIFFISPNFDIQDDKLRFTWGEKFVVDDMFLSPGGGGANAAVGFSRLGISTALWARLGNDIFGCSIKEVLEKEGVNTDFLEVDRYCKTAISTLMSGPRGERSIVMYRGKADLLNTSIIKNDDFWQTQWLYIGDLTGDLSSFQDSLFAKAKQKNIKVVFIPGHHQLDLGAKRLAKVLDNVDVLILNLYEACKLLNEPYLEYEQTATDELTMKRVEELMSKLADFGPKIVAVTKGPDGVQAFDGCKFYHHAPPNVPVPTDTTGAGDSFSCGFVAGLVKDLTFEQCLDLGVANSGSVISQYGAQPGLLTQKQAAELK